MLKIYAFKLLNLIINGILSWNISTFKFCFNVWAANSSCLMINLWFLICLTYLSTLDLEIYTIIHMQFDTKLWLTQEAFNMTCFSLTHNQGFNKQIHRLITKLSSKYIYIRAALYSQHSTISSKTHTYIFNGGLHGQAQEETSCSYQRYPMISYLLKIPCTDAGTPS